MAGSQGGSGGEEKESLSEGFQEEPADILPAPSVYLRKPASSTVQANPEREGKSPHQEAEGRMRGGALRRGARKRGETEYYQVSKGAVAGARLVPAPRAAGPFTAQSQPHRAHV